MNQDLHNRSASSVRGMVYAAMFGAATAAGAYLIIPLPPVPVTLQTFFMALAAILLGARLGAMSQAVYILLGIIGLPVFAGGKAGLGVLLGPTGGYLLGFVAGAWLTGRIVQAGGRAGPFRIALAVIAGYGLVYALGVSGLCLIARLSLFKALSVGVVPFLAGDALKITGVTLLAVKLQDRIRI
ncbi:MAG: biotin transporter BioY [Thermodesulfobacteriota bacterium]